MNEKDDRVYLLHILDCCNRIGIYLQKVNRQAFMENNLLQDGVVRQLEIIGEAASNISRKTKNKFPDTEWRDIADMRNRLIHEYFNVDYVTVWLVATEEVPELKTEIQHILDEIKPSSIRPMPKHF